MGKLTKKPKSYRGTDLILEEIWRIKDEMSAAHGHDVHRLFAYLREQQKLSGHPVVNLQARRKKPVTSRRKPAGQHRG